MRLSHELHMMELSNQMGDVFVDVVVHQTKREPLRSRRLQQLLGSLSVSRNLLSRPEAAGKDRCSQGSSL
jgi:hypothetical protein